MTVIGHESISSRDCTDRDSRFGLARAVLGPGQGGQDIAELSICEQKRANEPLRLQLLDLERQPRPSQSARI